MNEVLSTLGFPRANLRRFDADVGLGSSVICCMRFAMLRKGVLAVRISCPINGTFIAQDLSDELKHTRAPSGS